jgi:hypothetical protein
MDHLTELKPVLTPFDAELAQEWAYRLDGDGGWVDDPSYVLPPGFHVEIVHDAVVIGGPVVESWSDAHGSCEDAGCHCGPDLGPAQAYFRGRCKWHHDLDWYRAGQPKSDMQHLWWESDAA